MKNPLEQLQRIAREAFNEWDADNDSRVGKLLKALAGLQPGYRADIDALHTSLSAPTEDEEIVVACLAACEATIRHLWDIAGRFDSADCNAIRDEIHRLNTVTLQSIRDLAKRLPAAVNP